MNPISMGRRSFVRGVSLATVAAGLPVAAITTALPGSANAAEAAPPSRAQLAIDLMVSAFEAETDAYLDAELPDETANQFSDQAIEAESAVLNLPKAEAMASPDYLRHWRSSSGAGLSWKAAMPPGVTAPYACWSTRP
jgi:hypothetical protein